MKLGTRLALVLLVALTPVVALYTWFNVHASSQVYMRDLKRETRATTRSLRAGLYHYVRRGDWNEVKAVLEQLRVQSTETAVFKRSGELWFALPDFPAELFPTDDAFARVNQSGGYEINRDVKGRHWFCQIAPLSVIGNDSIGFLLVAQDLTDIRQDLQHRLAVSIGAGCLVLAAAALIIMLATRRYVTQPLFELSRRVTHFSSSNEDSDRLTTRNEVESLTQEFRRLHGHLSAARERLISEHRRQLELERTLRHSDKLATIGTLASGLAHEIGSPMAVIRGRAEHLLNSSPAPHKVSEGLSIIISQIDRISGIVHRLLDYARRREALRVPSDVRPIILRALRLLETEAARRRVEIAAELGTAPLITECDADQLQQVFVNLGMNALDAMNGKGGALRVSAKPCATGNGHGDSLQITFEDDGPGVAEEDRDHIFEPFFTTKPPGKGTGMGLAVSQSIVQDHEGEIAMEPCPDGGARFIVILPAARDNEARQASV